jgi:hypothetical protein
MGKFEVMLVTLVTLVTLIFYPFIYERGKNHHAVDHHIVGRGSSPSSRASLCCDHNLGDRVLSGISAPVARWSTSDHRHSVTAVVTVGAPVTTRD